MILLDTNVISELMKAAPEARVLAWIDALPRAELFLTSVTQAELLYGVALLPAGKRREAVARALDAALERLFRDRVLPFDSAAASAFAGIAADRRGTGRPICAFDGQIAANCPLPLRKASDARNSRFRGVRGRTDQPMASAVRVARDDKIAAAVAFARGGPADRQSDVAKLVSQSGITATRTVSM
jgi:predicted nucleic acid-binding protein